MSTGRNLSRLFEVPARWSRQEPQYCEQHHAHELVSLPSLAALLILIRNQNGLNSNKRCDIIREWFMRKTRQRLWERGHLARETNAPNCADDFRGQDARAPMKMSRSLQFQSRYSGLFRVTHASRVLAWASRPSPKAGVRRDAGRSTRDACATRNDSPDSGQFEHKLEESVWRISC